MKTPKEMNAKRIKEIQKETAYFDSRSVQQALLKVWNECMQQQPKEVDKPNPDDKIVIELSDNELKLVTRRELWEMQKEAIKFDGFEGWLVKGRLIPDQPKEVDWDKLKRDIEKCCFGDKPKPPEIMQIIKQHLKK